MSKRYNTISELITFAVKNKNEKYTNGLKLHTEILITMPGIRIGIYNENCGECNKFKKIYQ